MGIYVEEDVPVVAGDWVEKACAPIPVKITIWSCEVDDCSGDEDDGMNEGVSGDDERISI